MTESLHERDISFGGEKMQKYIAVFRADEKIFAVVCYGFYKSENSSHIFPSVEEAKEEYSSNAEYIGLK